MAAGLRAVYIIHHRVNADEPQHLHIAWAWAQGLLPYRDVFDNHSPLFSLLMSPLIRAIGERPDIVILARIAMVPFTLFALLMTWAIGRRLFSARTALWGAALAAFAPDFMLGSVEYRTDQLWAGLWIGTLAVFILGRMTRPRAFLFGLALGATLAVSMKTSLWILSLSAALAASVVLLHGRGVRLRARWMVERLALALGGAAVVPGLFAIYFAGQGAWRSMIYCVLWHNVVPNLGSWHEAPLRALLIPVAAPLLWFVARRFVEKSSDPALGARRAVLFLTAGVYYVALEGFWPLVTRQDVLPFLPLAAVMVAPALLELAELAARHGAARWMVRSLALAPALAIAFELAWTQRVEAVWRDNDVGVEVSFLRDVLRLTRRGEPVMDIRGETIFRPRPYYFALEAVTLARIAGGLIPDDIPEHLIATRTAVAVPDSPDFPERSRAFLNANYLAVGALRVVGKSIRREANGSEGRFEIVVPQRYAVVCEHGPAKGLLDGVAFEGLRDLAPGWHTYAGDPAEGRATVLWSEAVARTLLTH